MAKRVRYTKGLFEEVVVVVKEEDEEIIVVIKEEKDDDDDDDGVKEEKDDDDDVKEEKDDVEGEERDVEGEERDDVEGEERDDDDVEEEKDDVEGEEKDDVEGEEKDDVEGEERDDVEGEERDDVEQDVDVVQEEEDEVVAEQCKKAKRTITTNLPLEIVIKKQGEGGEECARSDGDESDDDVSDEESDVSSIDSGSDETFLNGVEVTLEQETTDTGSDEDWEPVSKKPHTEGNDNPRTSGEETPPSPSKSGSNCGRPAREITSSSSQAETPTSTSDKRWNDVDVPDVTPPQPTFRPSRTPGPQPECRATSTVLQLFQLFFTDSMLQTVIKNTNDYGSAGQTNTSSPWTDMTLQDMYAFTAMVIYMGLVKLPEMTDYWRGSKIYSLPFPKKLLTGKKFLRICRSLHLSSMADDAANEKRRGTAKFDRLCKIKPLYTKMREACKQNYHPGQEILIDERMVASKSHFKLTRYMKNKRDRGRYKLFALADSSNGYTWDFFVYEGKVRGESGKGLGYRTVMELVNTQMLGTGYKLFVDNFYTSPSLFCDLLKKRIWACGAVRPTKIGFPKTKINSLDSKSPRGSIRWIRKDPLLFLQWRDTRDMLLCSTFHTAHAGDTIQRRVRDADGNSVFKDISIPPAVKEYKQCLGGVELSDVLIHYYKVIKKTRKWYKTFFYHFLDIAIVNAFLLYKSVTKGKGEVPMNQKAFRETLVEELAAASADGRPDPSPAPRTAHHKPVYLCRDRTVGRLRCRHCHKKTPVKCYSCDVALCFQLNRDCYNDWHNENDL